MSHPQTPEAIALAQKGDWSLLQSIMGWEYIQSLRSSMTDDDIFRYLARAH